MTPDEVDVAERFMRPCPYAPAHQPDHLGRCSWCLSTVPEPWYMRRRPTPPQLVGEVAARYGMSIGAPAAGKIAEALLTYADTAVAVREPINRQMWEDPKYVARLRQHMRRTLFAKLADEGYLPTALPSESVRYFEMPLFYPEFQRSEVPPAVVEAGAAWFEAEIELRAPARRPYGGPDGN